MAKLEAASLHTLSPVVSKYAKFAIKSDGGISQITKWSCITPPSLAIASATSVALSNCLQELLKIYPIP